MDSGRPKAAPARTNTGLSTASLGGGSKQCYICLQSEKDAPEAQWVSACPCSLETHEDCMLHWIAEQEVRQGGGSLKKNNIRCPACQAPINVEEPYDAVVAFRDKLHRTYSRVSPLVLLGMFTTGTGIALVAYGTASLSTFAGPNAAARWLASSGVQYLTYNKRRISWLPPLRFIGKVHLLSVIGPIIVLSRALPGQMRTLALPASMFYAGTLFARNRLPEWPPSPEWACTLFPYLNLIYSHLYYEYAGPLEKRLNRALRGLPPTEDPEEQQAPHPAPQPNAQDGGNRGEGDAGEQDEGLWATVTWIWRALFDDLPNEMEGELALEVRIGAANDDDDEDEANRELADVIEDVPVVEQLPVEEAAGAEAELAATTEQDHVYPPEDPPLAAEQVWAAEPGPEAPQAQDPQDQHDRNNAAAAPAQGNAANENRNNATANTLTEIMNGLTTSLLFPAISYSMGELLRAIMPRQWVQEPPQGFKPTGLLQMRWGRSLLGGCMFVVLKDMYVLYTKYRRVQVKLNRKVRNVEKKAGRTNGITR